MPFAWAFKQFLRKIFFWLTWLFILSSCVCGGGELSASRKQLFKTKRNLTGFSDYQALPKFYHIWRARQILGSSSSNIGFYILRCHHTQSALRDPCVGGVAHDCSYICSKYTRMYHSASFWVLSKTYFSSCLPLFPKQHFLSCFFSSWLSGMAIQKYNQVNCQICGVEWTDVLFMAGCNRQ